jgi:hypothetical protein
MSDTRNSDGPGMTPVVSETRARQGVTGHNVRYVLVSATLALIIAFVIVYFFFFS